MNKYAMEKWLLGSALVLAGLITIPSYAHALNVSDIGNLANRPRMIGLAMLVCYLTIRLSPSNRQHF